MRIRPWRRVGSWTRNQGTCLDLQSGQLLVQTYLHVVVSSKAMNEWGIVAVHHALREIVLGQFLSMTTS